MKTVISQFALKEGLPNVTVEGVEAPEGVAKKYLEVVRILNEALPKQQQSVKIKEEED